MGRQSQARTLTRLHRMKLLVPFTYKLLCEKKPGRTLSTAPRASASDDTCRAFCLRKGPRRRQSQAQGPDLLPTWFSLPRTRDTGLSRSREPVPARNHSGAKGTR